MQIPKAIYTDIGEWAVDFVGNCRIETRAMEITAVASAIPAVDSGGHSATKGRRKLFVRNHVPPNLAGPTLFIGGSAVTVSTGYPVYPNELLELDITARVRVFGVTFDSEDPVEVRTLEVV